MVGKLRFFKVYEFLNSQKIGYHPGFRKKNIKKNTLCIVKKYGKITVLLNFHKTRNSL